MARNATPGAMPLPPIAAPIAGYIFHNVRFREWERFDCHSTLDESDLDTYIRIEPLFLHITNEHVAARFVWSWIYCGAPQRDSHDLFRLSLGQWGRFTCNGRFGRHGAESSNWNYQKTVFNVGFVSHWDEKLFTKSLPDVSDSRLAILK